MVEFAVGVCRRSPRRSPRRIEQLVLRVRRSLQRDSALGEYGAEAIHRELAARGRRPLPAVRTIGRILERCGALDGRRRVRRQAPPPGWYLARLAQRHAELDSFDIIEDLVIRGGQAVNVLTGISLHGALCGAWPAESVTARFAVESLLAHWREFGLPAYAKFDNDTVFQGAHQFPDKFGRVTRLCLALGVTPVFAPPLRRGFQADIEGFNGRWERKVWERYRFPSRADVIDRSGRFVAAHRDRHAVRIEDAPARRPFPDPWKLDLQAPLHGTVIYVRETNSRGQVVVLGHRFEGCSTWCRRLVRAEADLSRGQIRLYALRRRDPHRHQLLATHPYDPPRVRFQE